MARSRLASPTSPRQPPDTPRAGRLWLAGVRELRRIGVRGLDLLLPPQCPVCGAAVERQGAICAGCFSRISFVSMPFCERCGVPFTEQGQAQDGSCPACIAAPPAFRQARAALRYDRQSRDLILPLKHADRLELAPVLAGMMRRAGAALLERAEILVPVPLHRRRLFHRGYNQAAVLARLLGRLADRPVQPDGMVRLHATASLDHRSAEERAQLLAGAFAVRPSRIERIKGRRVLLVDDVMTSGATADLCARALLRAGAAEVDVLAAARVPDPRLG